MTADILAALNILVLERLDVDSFSITGTVPDWLTDFCPQKVVLETGKLLLKEVFPFLENFLIDAEEFWLLRGEKKLKSGIWYQLDLSGKEYHFEAIAVYVDSKKYLLIESLDETYNEKQYIIQKARENQLNYQYIVKENQKKEVLIHCIIHDMAGQLSGIHGCLSLLQFENFTQPVKDILQLGKIQCQRQEMLIREILDGFSAEVKSLETFAVDVDKAPSALISAQEIIQLLSPSFALNKMQLRLAANIDVTADWRVIGDESRLDRVIANLVENAFRHSPLESTVTIGLEQDGDYILVSVDDEGSGVPPENVESLFQKFSQGKGKSGRVGLGLYSCRITVERWGGEIGYSPRPEGGSRFWFRLPKPRRNE
jgi:signal transduction histidine kinase